MSLRALGIFGLLAACSSQPATIAQPELAWERPHLDPAYASQAVKLSLHCVDTEEPHYNEGQGTKDGIIRKHHPAFFGCYDWHSAVHGHWAMLRAMNQVPGLEESEKIKAVLGRHLKASALQAELAYQNAHPGFERPYGWAWALRLSEEIHRSSFPEAKSWAKAIAPFESRMEALMLGYLREGEAPNRKGQHYNTAYALVHAWDYAIARNRTELKAEIERFARGAYLSDAACVLANEPGAHDFISPCFVEADLMRRVLGRAEFSSWFDRFLPRISPEHLKPVIPGNLKDPYQVHLVGLMYQKAGAILGVAELLPEGDPRRATLIRASREQSETAWKCMFESDYGGPHWLASFAIHYYTAIGLD